MTAAEALQIAIRNNEQSLNKIYSQIKHAAETGSTMIIVRGLITKITYDQLIVDGYKMAFEPVICNQKRDLFSDGRTYEVGTFVISWC